MDRLSRVNNKETFIKENITFYSQAEIYPSLRQTEIEKSPINFTSRGLFRILPFQHFTAFTLFSTIISICISIYSEYDNLRKFD